MSSIKYKSQIDMPIPPTEGNHLVRLRDFSSLTFEALGDFMYELETQLDFITGIIESMGGVVTIARPFLFYDAEKTIQAVMTAQGYTEIQDALDWLNAQTTSSFIDSSGNGHNAVLQNQPFEWTADGLSINDPAVVPSDVSQTGYVSLPVGEVNDVFRSMNWTWMTAIRITQANVRNNFLSDYDAGMGLTFELSAGNALRFFRSGSPDVRMPVSTWAAQEGQIAYMAMSHNENIDGAGTRLLNVFIDGKLMWTYSYKGGANLSASPNVAFWWGNDRRLDGSIATKGVLKMLKIFDKPLTNYEVLKQMQEDMAAYGV